MKKNFYQGHFALGLSVGLFAATLTAVYISHDCTEGSTTLWFCDEDTEIVLKTLDVLASVFEAMVWPVSLLIALLIMRPELRRLLNRASKIAGRVSL